MQQWLIAGLTVYIECCMEVVASECTSKFGFGFHPKAKQSIQTLQTLSLYVNNGLEYQPEQRV